MPRRRWSAWPANCAGPLVIDEAYVDFADDARPAPGRLPDVIVTRTLSKSYCLAGLRFGFAVAQPALVRELVKVKDSYNCDVLSLAGAAGGPGGPGLSRETTAKILPHAGAAHAGVARPGLRRAAEPGEFRLGRRTDRPVKPIYEELKRRKILVRYMNYEGHGDGLRITVGTDAEIDRLLDELRGMV